MFSGKGRKDTAAAGRRRTSRVCTTGSPRPGLLGELERIEAWDKKSIAALGVSAILDDAVGFREQLAAGAELLARHELDSAAGAIIAIDRALQREGEFRAAVTAAGNAVRQAEARKLVAEMPVERLKDATNGQLRISALTGAGITQRAAGPRPGRTHPLPPRRRRDHGQPDDRRGPDHLADHRRRDAGPDRHQEPVRAATDLLKAMRAWDAARSIKSATADLAAADSLRPLLKSLDRKTSHVVVVPESEVRRRSASARSADVERRARTPRRRRSRGRRPVG